MAIPLTRIDLDGDDEVEQAARILQWVGTEKEKLATKAASLKQMEEDARSVIEEALGGSDGPAAEGFYQNRPIVRWNKFTSHRLDQKLLKKQRPDVYEAFYKETTERKFTIVTPSKEEES